MNISKKAQAGIVVGAAVATLTVAGIAGSTVANAANSTPAPKATSSLTGTPGDQQRPVEEALTGATADSVKAAVLAKYPDATIDRLEKDADGGAVYEAHITKKDGTRVTVLLDASFAITGEQAGGPRGGHGDGNGGRHGRPHAQDQGGANGKAGHAPQSGQAAQSNA